MSDSVKAYHRVVVTGIGVGTALGWDERILWTHMLSGRTGIRKLTEPLVAGCRTAAGAELSHEEMEDQLRRQNLRPFDRTADIALLVAHQALKQARLIPDAPPYVPQPIPTLFGSGVGPAASLFAANQGFFNKGVRGVRPTTVPRCMPNAITSHVSIRFRLTGPNFTIASACASSTNAIGVGFRMIRDGYARQVLCGGADACLNPFVFSAWNNLNIMSKNPDPERACRPFDLHRDGCILGEGAGALVLESLDSALARQAAIRAEIIGYGESSDAGHITNPSLEGQASAIKAALQSAGVHPSDIGFINAHGTATRANDACECQAIRHVMGEQTHRIRVASNKAFFGHLLGASGAVETIVTILGLENRLVPPSLNLDQPDPECGLSFVGSLPLDMPSPIAMKNSFGFGGGNAVLILRRWNPPRPGKENVHEP